MRVLISALGSAGDVHPFIGLGRRLAHRGHTVTLFASEVFRPVVEEAGLEMVAAGDELDYRRLIADPDLWHPRRGALLVLELAAERLPRLVDRLLERVVPGDTVLVGSSLALGARLVAEAQGIPMATVHLSPAVLRSTHRPPRLPGLPLPERAPRWLKDLAWWALDRVIDPLVRPALDAERLRLGLAPVRRPLHGWANSPELVLGLFPEWFAPPQPDWPESLELVGFVRFDRDELEVPDAALEGWLDRGEPPLVVTAGSAHHHAAGFLGAAVELAERLGRRALLVTPERGDLPAHLPEGVRHRSYVPFSRLLPRAAALVHHGGIGTLAQALAAGIPQLVVPFGFDQLDNGSRLETLGVGALLPPRRFTGAAATKRLAPLLDSPEVASRCWELASRVLSGDPAGRAADLVEGLMVRKVAAGE